MTLAIVRKVDTKIVVTAQGSDLVAPLVNAALASAAAAATSAAAAATSAAAISDTTSAAYTRAKTTSSYSTRLGYGSFFNAGTEITADDLLVSHTMAFRAAAGTTQVRYKGFLRLISSSENKGPGDATTPDQQVLDLTFAIGAFAGLTAGGSEVNITVPFGQRIRVPAGYAYGFEIWTLDVANVRTICGIGADTTAYADVKRQLWLRPTATTWSAASTLSPAGTLTKAATFVQRDPATAIASDKIAANAAANTTLAGRVTGIESSLSGWAAITPAPTLETNHYYRYNTGEFIADANYDIASVPVALGDLLRVTTTIGGNDRALVVYLNAGGGYAGNQKQGGATVENLDKYALTIPPGATVAKILTRHVGTPLVIEKFSLQTAIAAQIRANSDAITVLQSTGARRLAGKKILVLGNSIAEGGTWISDLAALTGATIFNMSLGASVGRGGVAAYRAGDDTYGWTKLSSTRGWAWENLFKALGKSAAECEDLIANYETKWRDRLLTDVAKPTTLSDADKALIRGSTYEQRLDPYLTGANAVDIILWQHVRNDALRYGVGVNADAELTTVPADPYDRAYFIGAANFIHRRALNANSRIQFGILGHIENDQRPECETASQALADRWRAPFLNLARELGWTQELITVSGTPTKIFDVYCPDTVHPHTDPTGKACKIMTGKTVPWAERNLYVPA